MRRASLQKSPLSVQPVVLPNHSPIIPEETNGHAQLAIYDRASSPASSKSATFDVSAAIRTFKLFEQAPEELIELIMAKMRSRMVEKGDEICREGEDAKAMYWVIRGSVAVVSRDAESQFAELRAGQFFG